MTGQFERLFVIWGDQNRRRHPIGQLWRQGDGYAFAYSVDLLKNAEEEGFQLLSEFPERRGPDDPYLSKSLFPTFKKRVPSSSRPDYRELLSHWGAVTEDPLEILARSGGVLHTDTIELAEYRPPDDELEKSLSFRLSGQRFAGPEVELSQGQELTLERDRGNPKDDFATFVLTLGGVRVGWVPIQYSHIVARLIDDGIPLRSVVERRLLLPEPRGRWVVRIERLPKESTRLQVAEGPHTR